MVLDDIDLDEKPLLNDLDEMSTGGFSDVCRRKFLTKEEVSLKETSERLAKVFQKKVLSYSTSHS